MPRNKSWYEINNAASDEANIYIYDEISYYGITAKDFVKDLAGVKAGTINLRINSPGGNVFDGVAIYNALKEHPATVNVKVDGLAASIASIIAMAGDKVHMASNAMMMIHRAWTIALGNSEELAQTAEVLNKIDETLVKTYSERTGKSQRAVRQMMSDETWMSAEEAKAHGFADSIGDAADAKASFDLAKYAKAPAEALNRFAAKHNEHTERDLEQILRDAGLSRTSAKAAVAAAKGADQREAEETSNLASKMKIRSMITTLTT